MYTYHEARWDNTPDTDTLQVRHLPRSLQKKDMLLLSQYSTEVSTRSLVNTMPITGHGGVNVSALPCKASGIDGDPSSATVANVVERNAGRGGIESTRSRRMFV